MPASEIVCVIRSTVLSRTNCFRTLGLIDFSSLFLQLLPFHLFFLVLRVSYYLFVLAVRIAYHVIFLSGNFIGVELHRPGVLHSVRVSVISSVSNDFSFYWQENSQCWSAMIWLTSCHGVSVLYRPVISIWVCIWCLVWKWSLCL